MHILPIDSLFASFLIVSLINLKPSFIWFIHAINFQLYFSIPCEGTVYYKDNQSKGSFILEKITTSTDLTTHISVLQFLHKKNLTLEIVRFNQQY